MYKFCISLLTLYALVACSSEPTSSPEPEVSIAQEDTTSIEPTIEQAYPEQIEFSHLATFLAAREGTSDSPYKGFESKEEWIDFKNSIDKIWRKTNEKLPTMRDWSKKEMKDANSGGGTLFYPFSGPDFLHADIFFPNYDSIVMIGLEPIGSYPNMKEKLKDTIGKIYLNGIHKSLHALLGLSFFRTIAMADDFNGEVDGTLPVLMHFMVRTGHTVMFQERVAVQSDGSLSTDLSNVTDSTYFGNRYYFKRPNEEKVRVLTYFAVNLQNTPYASRGGLVAKGLKTRTDFVSYLNQLNIKATYLKSASYLLHRPSFDIVRDIILDNSNYILQDDSGIPVTDFDRDLWDLTFYGTYEEPISLFDERLQEDLAQIYDSTEIIIKDLPFGIGYQHRRGTSNLMQAIRK